MPAPCWTLRKQGLSGTVFYNRPLEWPIKWKSVRAAARFDDERLAPFRPLGMKLTDVDDAAVADAGGSLPSRLTRLLSAPQLKV